VHVRFAISRSFCVLSLSLENEKRYDSMSIQSKATVAGAMFLGFLSHTAFASVIGLWTFEGGSLKDSTGNFSDLTLHGNATISSGELVVSSQPGVIQVPTGWAGTNGMYSGPTISNKTMVVWLTLTSISNKQGYGSAMTIDSLTTDKFDGMVFGEFQTDRWASGSNTGTRSQNFNPGFQETTTGTMFQLAYSYGVSGSNVQITAYRNGVQFGQYNSGGAASWSGNDVEVIFGARHTLPWAPFTKGGIDARIAEARLYNTVLTQSEIAGLSLTGNSAVPEPASFGIFALGVGLTALGSRKKRPFCSLIN
jgi:hypothetical protein